MPAALARARGLPAPADPTTRAPDLPLPHRQINQQQAHQQEALFDREPAGPTGEARLAAIAAVYASQIDRIAASADPIRLRLLVAAESAAALAAEEMSQAGLPWCADVHDAVLAALLGPRPRAGLPPPRLRALAEQIATAFGRPVNPDSPADLLRAFGRDGVSLPSTRSQVLRSVNHSAVAPLLAYKELARLHAAHGWAWLDTWVADRRFRPEYVPGGVVSGRWATRGGGALQIPHAVRRAVVADPGWLLVVADAAHLEPRVLAALSGDPDLAAAARQGDLYSALAGQFGGDRARAKVALLSAMYGGVRGEAGALVAALRARFPLAGGYVEQAAQTGERGGLVRSRLGRTCPPPSTDWWARQAAAAEPGADPATVRQAGQAARDRGRFTRNFVIQASAADWALVLLAAARRRLAAARPRQPAPELVFFQHDEVVVHTPAAAAETVVAAVTEAAAESTRLVFPGSPVPFPLDVAVVACYADAG